MEGLGMQVFLLLAKTQIRKFSTQLWRIGEVMTDKTIFLCRNDIRQIIVDEYRLARRKTESRKRQLINRRIRLHDFFNA